MSAWLSDCGAFVNQGIFGLGSFSPAATRLAYSLVFSQARLPREIIAAFFVVTSGAPLTVARS